MLMCPDYAAWFILMPHCWCQCLLQYAGCWFDVSECFAALQMIVTFWLDGWYIIISLLSGENLLSLKCIRNQQLRKQPADSFTNTSFNTMRMVSQAQLLTDISQPTFETRHQERFSHDSNSVALYVFESSSVLIRDCLWLFGYLCLCLCVYMCE